MVLGLRAVYGSVSIFAVPGGSVSIFAVRAVRFENLRFGSVRLKLVRIGSVFAKKTEPRNNPEFIHGNLFYVDSANALKMVPWLKNRH